jgi:hypothetical protein
MSKSKAQFLFGIAKVMEFCEIKNKEIIKDNLILDHEVKGNNIIITKEMKMPNELGRNIKTEIAQIKFNKEKRYWRLYWYDFGKWCLYSELKPTQFIGKLIEEIESNATGLF